VLNATSCATLECVRSVSEEILRAANSHLVDDVPGNYGGGVFGPAIGFSPVLDGSHIPETPELLYREGRFHRAGLKAIMVGSMEFEVRSGHLHTCVAVEC
jgi:hypothetical protein